MPNQIRQGLHVARERGVSSRTLSTGDKTEPPPGAKTSKHLAADVLGFALFHAGGGR